ncbi:RNA methyltransferase [Cinnamomum micranthum f. kanehirae]|uniref:RNA methyltransferase n=1 Tax=Cinnamomum micranthum f. kanehirae TaxID=337451 RepID=A0A443N7P7_9MAGN|nr:RNA methyltransferase [Cinnamomum micranthum f. kanehirae]
MLSLSFLSTSRLVDPVSLPNLTSRITQPSPPPIPLPLQASSALQCQHFQSCSGCSHEWNLDRPILLDDAEKFFKRLGISDFSFDSGRLWEWRCRAKLAVRGSSDNPLIGLYEEGTHNVVDIPQCRAHHPKINSTVELLRQGITSLDVQPYDEDQGTGELRYVQMAVTTHNTSLPAAERYKTGKVQVTLVWNSNNEHSPSAEKLNALSYIIFGNRWRHLLGEKDLWEHIGGIDISLAPSSFGQANTQAFDSLLRKLQKYVPYGASVADIYAGAESKLSFEKSIGRLPKSMDSSISWHHADASVEPLHWLEGSDVVVVDPPRKGLHPSLIHALRTLPLSEQKAFNRFASLSVKEKDEKRPWILRAREASVHIESKTDWEEIQSWPQTLIYISCGWESFKEDCRSILSSEAWHLEKAHAFNFFPGTESIEVLAVFKRGSQVDLKKKKTVKKKKRKQ